MAKITSFIKDKIYLVQSGNKNILIHSEQDDWNFGIDTDNSRALSAKEMLKILNEPIVEDTEDITEEHRNILRDIVLKNPKAMKLIYGGKFGDLLPIKFLKNLKEEIKKQKIDKKIAKDNWDFFVQKLQEYKAAGIDPEKNKDAQDYLDSILKGRPEVKTTEQLLDTLKYLYKTDPSWIKKLGVDKTLDFKKEQVVSILIDEAPKLIDEIKKIGDFDWESMPSDVLANLIKSILRTKRINVDIKDIVVSSPVDETNTARTISFLGNLSNIAEIVRVFGVKSQNVVMTTKKIEAPKPQKKQKEIPQQTNKETKTQDKTQIKKETVKQEAPKNVPLDDWNIGD